MTGDEVEWHERGLAGVAGAFTGVAVGASTDPVAGVAVAPIVTEALIGWGEWWNRTRVNRASQLWASAADRLGVESPDLVSAADSDAKQDLLGRAILAGGNARYRAKIQALACVLVDGLRGDEAQVDSALMVVSALTDLEVPHVKVLAYLAGLSADSEIEPREGRARTMVGFLDENRGYSAVISNVVATLERHGLIRSEEVRAKDLVWVAKYEGSTQISDRFSVTRFGIHLLDLLRSKDTGPESGGE